MLVYTIFRHAFPVFLTPKRQHVYVSSHEWGRSTVSMRPKSGDALRELIRQDYSLASFALIAGCSRSMIHGLCTGDKGSCSDDLASRIAEALQVSVDVLFVPSKSPIRGRNISTVSESVA